MATVSKLKKKCVKQYILSIKYNIKFKSTYNSNIMVPITLPTLTGYPSNFTCPPFLYYLYRKITFLITITPAFYIEKSTYL